MDVRFADKYVDVFTHCLTVAKHALQNGKSTRLLCKSTTLPVTLQTMTSKLTSANNKRTTINIIQIDFNESLLLSTITVATKTLKTIR